MSISALVKQCTEIFCERLVKSDSEERAIVENHLFRFNIWAKSNGAISDSRDSLDCRLRKDVISHSLMQDLLTALLEALNSMYSTTCQRKTLSNAMQEIPVYLNQPAGLAITMKIHKLSPTMKA